MNAKRIDSSIHPLSPKGSSFLIDDLEWSPGQGIDLEYATLEDDKLIDWPMVYILRNDREKPSAYVGQTTNVFRRMREHAANPEKEGFTRADLIYSPEFNQSVITDYEHRLISLMSADKKYVITNKNEGLTESEYFSKNEYDRMFEDLWAELQKNDLVIHTIQQIEQSELFKYSPYKALNSDQEDACAKILETIKHRNINPSPIVVEGMPGTGKTVLAVFLLKALKDTDEFKDANIALIEPVPSLRKTLSSVLKTIGGLRSTDVLGPSDIAKPQNINADGTKHYDVLLVDEAHRLKQYRNIVGRKSFKDASERLGLNYKTCTEVDWVMAQAKIPIFFYDPYQTVKPASPTEQQFAKSVGKAAKNPIKLIRQMRVNGGKEYLDYVKDILWGKNPTKMIFQNYPFELHENILEFLNEFERTLEKHDLTRMVAGYAWPWKTKGKDPIEAEGLYDIEIEGIQLKWNCTETGWVDMGLKDPSVAQEVGCIHTIQGYDLTNAFVIIGNDIVYDPETDQLKCNRDGYYDKYGKNGTSIQELDAYIKNIYYVLLTCGIESTHVYACDSTTRDYLKRFMQVSATH